MKRIFYLLSTLLLASCCGKGTQSVDIAGQWQVQLDPENIGVTEQWFNRSFSSTLSLPGSLQEQGYGEKPQPSTVWWVPLDLEARHPSLEKYSKADDNFKLVQFLMPKNHYIGVAWYNREFEIPSSFEGKNITLSLQRCHWQSSVWVDGEKLGVDESLATPHTYSLSHLKSGKHTISIRMDNGHIYDLGSMPHSVSDQTQGTWNGIIGDMKIDANDLISIKKIDTYPNIAKKEVKVVVTIENSTKQSGEYSLSLDALGYNDGNSHDPAKIDFSGKLDGAEIQKVELIYPLGDKMELWDEFNPKLYNIVATLNSDAANESYSDSEDTNFGMREISSDGKFFYVNGKKVYMRGNVDCAVYPEYGYPPMSVEQWREVMKKHKEYGLNFVRYHSWTPPMEAFVAADELGLYLAPEIHEWSGVKKAAEHKFFKEESSRVLSYLGNHPSFVMMGLGNESFIEESIALDLISQWKNEDSRRLYTIKASSSSNPSSEIEFEVLSHIKDDSFEGGRIRTRYQAFWPPLPENTEFCTIPPQTTIDWNEGVEFHHNLFNIPLMSHELAQFCAYPDLFTEMERYKGYLRPTYLEIAAEQLEERGMIDQLDDFVVNSGMWQVELTREEFEAALRTRNLAGFQWLSLNDFTGQNSAPVGFTDAFYNPKKFVTAERTRRFCAPTVLLARLAKRSYKNSDTLKAQIDVTHFDKKVIDLSDLTVTVRNNKGEVVKEQKIGGKSFDRGSAQKVGDFEMSLSSLPTAQRYNLEVVSKANNLVNDWDFYVFSTDKAVKVPQGVKQFNKWGSDALAALERGEKVLLTPKIGTLKGNLPSCFTTTYWTSFGEEGGQSSACGIVAQNDHPLFKSFPTESYASWQWWDLLNFCQPMILDQFEEPYPWDKSYRPLIQPIDSWKLNRKLGLVVEAKVGKGSLIICSIDIESDLDSRVAALQFRKSLMEYVGSDSFAPANSATAEQIGSIFNQSKKSTKLNLQGLPTEG
ncbi:MAG: hypothetical protein R3Y50_00905 [Rikenellaceae bacterium]